MHCIALGDLQRVICAQAAPSEGRMGRALQKQNNLPSPLPLPYNGCGCFFRRFRHGACSGPVHRRALFCVCM